MRGFKSVASAQRFCRAYDEVRHALRFPSPRGRRLSLGERRWFYLHQVTRLLGILWNKPPDQTASVVVRCSQKPALARDLMGWMAPLRH
jgi:hypothetical protein